MIFKTCLKLQCCLKLVFPPLMILNGFVRTTDDLVAVSFGFFLTDNYTWIILKHQSQKATETELSLIQDVIVTFLAFWMAFGRYK